MTQQKQFPGFWISLALLFIYYLLISFSGYGTDDDVYRILRTGQDLYLNHEYNPSRFQGYLLPEIVIGISSLYGGHYLSNFFSVIMGVSVLYLFYSFLCKVFERDISLILTLIVGLNPYFILAATSSMDYIYGLFFLLLGIFLLDRGNYRIAALVFALALSSRMANALVVGFVFVYFLAINYPLDKKRFWKIFATGCMALLITILFYVPVYIASDYSFKFFGYYIQGYDWVGYVTRFIYKNIAFLGLPLALFLVAVTGYNLLTRKIQLKRSILLYVVVLAIVVEQLKFLKIPIQTSFLLPAFMLMVTLYPFLLKYRRNLYIALFLTAFYNVVTIDFLKFSYELDPGAPDDKTLVATGAVPGLYINPGVTMEDVRQRAASDRRYFKEMRLPVQRHTKHYEHSSIQ